MPLERKIEDAAACLAAAPNLNSAVKKLVKSDALQDAELGGFVKGLRKTLKSVRKDALIKFVERSFDDTPEGFMLITRNAFSADIEPIINEIIDEYADKFNETFELDQMGAVSVTNGDDFESTAKAAIEKICSRVDESELPKNDFMKCSILFSLFERGVFHELESRGVF